MGRHRDGGTTVLAPGISLERHADVLVVSLEGEHDLASRDSLIQTIDGALDRRLAVVVDLREADFVDSVVAAVFLDARKKARRADLGLAIVLSQAPENGVRRMFELSLLTRVFPVYRSLDDAVSAVRAGFVESADPVTRTSVPRS